MEVEEDEDDYLQRRRGRSAGHTHCLDSANWGMDRGQVSNCVCPSEEFVFVWLYPKTNHQGTGTGWCQLHTVRLVWHTAIGGRLADGNGDIELIPTSVALPSDLQPECRLPSLRIPDV